MATWKESSGDILLLTNDTVRQIVTIVNWNVQVLKVQHNAWFALYVLCNDGRLQGYDIVFQVNDRDQENLKSKW